LGHLHAAHLVSQVSRNFPGNFPEASRKGLAEAAEGRRPDRRRDRESAQETGGLAAGWAYLARSLTAASTAFVPSGLEFETRDGSHSGAVATGRHSLDGAKTVGLCSLPEMPCALLLLLRPCLKGQTQLTSTTQPPVPVPPWQLQLHREIASAPGLGWAGNAHCRPPAGQILKPCLACCIAPASTSHVRVLQLSVGCSGPFRGVQARDCNLLQMGSASTSDSKSAVVAAQRKLRCTG
jgi:hypothetical protein